MKDILKQIKALFNRYITLTTKKQWLKLIDKECDKYNKLSRELEAQNILVNLLIDQYKLIYKEDLRKLK